MIEMNKFRENQSKVPLDELMTYNGKYVAWSDDGTHILASDVDDVRLHNWIVASGLDSGEILVSYVDVPEYPTIGGGLFHQDTEDKE